MTHLDDYPGLIGVSNWDIGYTTKLKVYPSGSVSALTAERSIFHASGWESREPRGRSEILEEFPEADGVIGPTRATWEAQKRKAAGNLSRSKRRALTMVRDYALSNEFQYFVTLTLDQRRIDRYDYSAIVKGMRTWCDNQVRRKGLYYVLVPELHKDGALHFHGFFPAGVKVEDSGTIIPPSGGKPRKPRSKKQREAWLAEGGHVVYNLPDWGYGYSTAIELYGNYAAAVAYVCKYISKARDKVGGRWYFSGGKLRKPDIQLTDMTMEEALRSEGATEYQVDAIGLRLVYSFTGVNLDRDHH